MAIVRKKKTLPQKEKTFQETHDIKKLFLYVCIVNEHNSSAVINIAKRLESNVQFVQHGEGTANRQIMDILGIEENNKEIVISILKEEKLNDMRLEMEAFFASSKRNKGIGFSIPMTSIVGVTIYQLLANE